MKFIFAMLIVCSYATECDTTIKAVVGLQSLIVTAADTICTTHILRMKEYPYQDICKMWKDFNVESEYRLVAGPCEKAIYLEIGK